MEYLFTLHISWLGLTKSFWTSENELGYVEEVRHSCFEPVLRDTVNTISAQEWLPCAQGWNIEPLICFHSFAEYEASPKLL